MLTSISKALRVEYAPSKSIQITTSLGLATQQSSLTLLLYRASPLHLVHPYDPILVVNGPCSTSLLAMNALLDSSLARIWHLITMIEKDPLIYEPRVEGLGENIAKEGLSLCWQTILLFRV